MEHSISVWIALLVHIGARWNTCSHFSTSSIIDDWAWFGVLGGNCILLSVSNIIPETIHLNGFGPLRCALESIISFFAITRGMEIWSCIGFFLESSTSLLSEQFAKGVAFVLNSTASLMYLLGVSIRAGTFQVVIG